MIKLIIDDLCSFHSIVGTVASFKNSLGFSGSGLSQKYALVFTLINLSFSALSILAIFKSSLVSRQAEHFISNSTLLPYNARADTVPPPVQVLIN